MKVLCKRVTLFVLILLKKIKGTSVYYVNGPETLPPPLSPEQEEDAFALMQVNLEKAREICEK